MVVHRFTLTFSRTRCERCRVERITGIACPDCGAAPGAAEVDVNLQRRQRVVAELLDLLATPSDVWVEHARIQTGLQMPRAVLPCFELFLDALKRAGKSDFRETDGLVSAVNCYRSLRQAVSEVVPRRPFAKPNEIASRVIDQLGALMTSYFQAHAARTPLEAQRHGEVAQRWLDELAVTAADLQRWLDRRNTVGAATTVAQSISVMLSDALELAGAASHLELVSNPPRHLSALFGTIEIGTILRYAWQRSFVDLFLDVDHFDAKLKLAAALFAEPHDAFEALLRDQSFQSDLRRLELEVLDEALRCQETLQSATVARQAARAVVALNSTVLEAAGRTVAAPIHSAAGTKTKPYTKLRGDNATGLIVLVATAAGLPELVSGLDPHLRTAQSHAAITYHEDELRTDLNQGGRAYRYEDLVDGTFEALESYFAVLLCVHQAMERLGIESYDEMGYGALGLTPQEVIDTLLPGLGAPIGAAELRDQTLHLTATTNSPTGVTTALAGVLRAFRANEVIEVKLTQPDGTLWSIPAKAFDHASFNLDDTFATEIAALRIQRHWRASTGAYQVPDTVVRKWVALRAIPALSGPAPFAIARLRQLRQVADEVGDPGCSVVLKAVTTVVRLRHMGAQPTSGERECLDTLQEWSEVLTEPEFL